MNGKWGRHQVHIALVALAVILMVREVPVQSGPVDHLSQASASALSNKEGAPRPQTGQALTRLADGRWLLTGGTAHPDQIAISTGHRAAVEILPQSLQQPRADHSASLLPDGSVLIYGGRSADGNVLNTAELFVSATTSLTWMGPLGLAARAGQATTVLSDGRLLIVGGIGADGKHSPEPEVYDPVSHDIEHAQGLAELAGLAADTELLPSGDVLVWAGNSDQGRTSAWVYHPDRGEFKAVDSQQALQLLNPAAVVGPPVVLSQPARGSTAPIDQPLAIRFSQPGNVASLNSTTVTLIGPNGVEPAQVTPVDNGRLLFVIPSHDLVPSADYTLFVSNARWANGQALPFSTVGFRTMALAPQAPLTSTSTTGSRQSTRPGTSVDTASRSTATSGAAATLSTSAQSPLLNKSALSASAESQTNASTSTTSKDSNRAAEARIASADERWIPTETNRHGRWNSHHRARSLQTLPRSATVRRALYGHPEILALTKGLRPKTAASGKLKRVVPSDVLRAVSPVTAVSGQVLRLTGQPLEGVTLTMAGHTAKTDANGEFTLLGVPSGHQVLVIDGNSANHDAFQYGRYAYGTTVVAGKDNALPFVIWLTALDTGHAQNIAAPTVAPTIVKNPEIPGLELRIPAGTVIRDTRGKVVTQVSLTAIPTDQTPFPLPFPVAVYFTIQPGSAHLEATAGQVNPGAQLIYPNFTQSRPGTRMRFWNYDPTAKGWYVYGKGRVSADGKQILPDPGVVIYQFSGAMTSDEDNSDDDDTNECSEGGDPVDCSSGLFLHENVDLTVSDVIPIEVRRSYRNRDPRSRAFGIGTHLSYDFFLVGTSDTEDALGDIYTHIDLILPNGQRIHYPRVSPGTSYADAVYQATSSPGMFFGSIIVWDADSNNSWVLTLRNGTRFRFPDSDGSTNARDAAVSSIIDRHGNRITLTRDSHANLTQITSPNGRHINLTYDAYGRVTQAADDLGRTISYIYDSSGHLTQVTDPASEAEQYSYDANDNLLVVTDKRGHAKVTNVYDSNNRVSTQTYADSTSSSFSYTLDSAGVKVVQADYTDPRGMITRRQFNSSGYPTQVITGLGLSIEQTVTFSRDPNTNLITSMVDPLGRTTSYTYDALGNKTSTTWLAGTAGAVTESVQFSDSFSQPTVITDPNGHAAHKTYNQFGDVTSISDPLGHTWTMTYDDEGRLLTRTDPNGHAITYTYFGADLASVTDALGHRRTSSADAVGRVISQTNALGAISLSAYNVLDLPSSNTDPNGAQVGFTYDENGNLVGVTDALSHTVSYARDVQNRVQSMTDPLLNTETYQYEPGGLTNQIVDRNGQLSAMTYDALGRLTVAGFGASVAHPTAFASTISNTWDAGNRLTEVDDSSSGIIARTYDDLDRLIEEVTPQGSVTYTYDAGGRRASMAVSGQPSVAYTWDNANRLTQLTQAAGTINGGVARSITFQYDDANRRTQAVFPNGIIASYTYDNADELVEIDYTRSDATALGNLTYTYDEAGHRNSIGGSLANASVPTTATNATYDADNRLTQFNSVSRTYDANGSLTSDGTNSFTWNARNQLVGVSGPTTATFAYDGVARRIQRTVSGVTKNYLYDGSDYVQEQDGSGTVVAALLKGVTDELFVRMTSTTISTPLADALGSVVAETDLSQTITTNYSYDPYGTTSTTGTSTGNPLNYVGRENDLPGLYFYRARYYEPIGGRFLSQDPLGIVAGPNRYTYVEGNPIDGRDPLGLCDEKKKCVPRPAVSAWICEISANSNIEYDVQRAANAAWGLRKAGHGKNDNPVWREGENWLTAAAWPGWFDFQGYVVNIYLWQYLKYLPGGESFSQDALDAGLDGHQHGNISKDGLKQWCSECAN